MASMDARGIKISPGSRCRSFGTKGTPSASRELAAVRLQRIASTNAPGIKTWSSDEATGMATPRRRACAQNHAAELLKKPEELGLRTGPHSRAARETRTGVEGVTTQGRPTELPTQARRSREARKPQSSRWTCHNIHIPAKYKYYIGLHYVALHGMVFGCIALYWIAWGWLEKRWSSAIATPSPSQGLQ